MPHWSKTVLLLGAAAALAACASSVEPGKKQSPAESPPAEWTARILYESDATIWSLFVADLLPPVAGPEVVVMDDRGRAALLESRGEGPAHWWLTMDGLWLGAAAFGDVDRARPGGELYLAGGRGNVYQVVALGQGGFECRAVWFVPDEIHALLLDEVVPHNPGPDLLACTLEGKIFLLTPGGGGDLWRGSLLHQDPGRVRNVVAHDFLPELDGKEIVYVSKSGRLVLLGWRDGELEERIIYEDAQGLARVALGRATSGGTPPVYTAGDDGRIRRFAPDASGLWHSEVIYEFPDEARGVAVGHFTNDARTECVAVFGYSREVVVLERKVGGDRFQPTTIFTDSDKGHWLTAADLDLRNAYDEILICGYSGRVTLLTRR